MNFRSSPSMDFRSKWVQYRDSTGITIPPQKQSPDQIARNNSSRRTTKRSYDGDAEKENDNKDGDDGGSIQMAKKPKLLVEKLKFCSACKQDKERSAFSKNQWKKNPGRCIECLATSCSGTIPTKTIFCSVCKENKDPSLFSQNQKKIFRKKDPANPPCCKQCIMIKNVVPVSDCCTAKRCIECIKLVSDPNVSLCCSTCKRTKMGSRKCLNNFSHDELQKGDDRRCKGCILKIERPLCSYCHSHQLRELYPKEKVEDPARLCVKCLSMLQCSDCKVRKFKNQFSIEEVDKDDDKDRLCNSCQSKVPCSHCNERHYPYNFSELVKADDTSRVCLACENILEEKRYLVELSMGPQQQKMPSFEIPGERPLFWIDDQNTWDDCHAATPSFQFKDDLPKLESLVGTYDLVFYYTLHDVDDGQSRATKGSLEFTFNQDGTLKGLVSMDNSVKNEIRYPSQRY